MSKPSTLNAALQSFRQAEAAYVAAVRLTGPDAQDAKIEAWRKRNAAHAVLRAAYGA